MIKKETMIQVGCVVAALMIATWFYLQWNPESFLRKAEPPVTTADIDQRKTEDFTGAVAGADIPRLFGAKEFSELIFDAEYVTAEPIDCIRTNVFTLKPWVDATTTRRVRGRAAGEMRKEQVVTGGFAVQEDYLPYYLLGLPDGSYILAQIPADTADALEQGEAVTLPVGQRVGVHRMAQQRLEDICRQYDVSLEDGVFYAIDNEWYEIYGFWLWALRFGAAAVLFFMVAVGAILLCDKFLLKKQET